MNPEKSAAPSFHRLTKDEVRALRTAIELNARKDCPIEMSSRDTTFAGVVDLDEAEIEADLINTVKSVPTHY